MIVGLVDSDEDVRVIVGLVDSDDRIKIKPKQMEVVREVRRRSTSSRHLGTRPSKRLDVEKEIFETLKSADALFELADRSGDGFLSREECKHYMKRHTDRSSEIIEDVFYMLDRDGDGKLSKEEVRYAFLKKRRDITGCQSIVDEHTIMATVNDADLLFDKANVSGDGVLSK